MTGLSDVDIPMHLTNKTLAPVATVHTEEEAPVKGFSFGRKGESHELWMPIPPLPVRDGAHCLGVRFWRCGDGEHGEGGASQAIHAHESWGYRLSARGEP